MDIEVRFAVLIVGILALYVLIWLQIHVARRYFKPIIEEELDETDIDDER